VLEEYDHAALPGLAALACPRRIRPADGQGGERARPRMGSCG